jgi:putative acetyltransferase
MTTDENATDPLPNLHGFKARLARDADSAAAAALIARIWAAYPGCVFEPAEEPDLAAVASNYAKKDGVFWVVEDGQGTLVATVAIAPTPVATGMVLHRLYVDASARRQGLASKLLDLAEGAARRRGAGFMELWSDTRFAEAHAFYARHGYTQLAGERALRDASDSYEFHFRKRL